MTIEATPNPRQSDGAVAFNFMQRRLSLVLPCSKQWLLCRNLRVAELEHQVVPRPMSRERPAMDGFKAPLVPEDSSQSLVLGKTAYDMYY